MPRPKVSLNLLKSLVLMGAGAVLHAACHDATPQSLAAPAQTPGSARSGAEAEVLAQIDDTVITVGDFQDRINKQSPYVRARYTSLEKKREFLDNLVRFEVLAKEGKAKGFEKDEEVQRTMKQVMVQKLMKDESERVKITDISDADVKKYFDEHPDEFNPPAEVRAAHILVRDEKTARTVLADPRLKGKDDEMFRKLVAEYSIDLPTKERGGDLRYFNEKDKELPPAIVKAAFSLSNLGDVAGPVKTSAGYHIVKLTGQHKSVARKFEEVAPQIRNRLFRDRRNGAMEDYVKGLRAKAKIEIHEDKLAKVQIETAPAGAWNQPGVPPPSRDQFHPGAPGAPQAGAAYPGMPAGSQGIQMPPGTPPPGSPAPSQSEARNPFTPPPGAVPVNPVPGPSPSPPQ